MDVVGDVHDLTLTAEMVGQEEQGPGRIVGVGLNHQGQRTARRGGWGRWGREFMFLDIFEVKPQINELKYLHKCENGHGFVMFTIESVNGIVRE